MAVDRRDHIRNHFVYRAFDRQGRVLYIGCSQNMTARWQQHRFSNRHWVVQTERVRLQGPYSYKTARAIEKAAIETEQPRYGWTPERGRRLKQKSTWVDHRLSELMNGRRPWEMSFDAFSALSDVAQHEADARFPNIWNSDNHPTHGVPEGRQPYLAYAHEGIGEQTA